LRHRITGVTLASRFLPIGFSGKHVACFYLEVGMSLELFNQLEQRVTDTVEALEMMKLENETLRNENTQLKQEHEEWERRLSALLTKFDDDPA